METLPITYFSDVLCIWAYIGQLRVDAVQAAYGQQVRFDFKFCSVFGDTARKIATVWGPKGGADGFNAHLRHVAEAFPEAPVHPDIWRTVRPASSTGAHLFLKAAQLAEAAGDIAPGAAERLTRALRQAFFMHARDIVDWDVQRETAKIAGVDTGPLDVLIRRGAAFAALASDYQDADAMRIQGSPSLVLNQGRQTLYGNVGFKIMEANIQELLRAPHPDNASWC